MQLYFERLNLPNIRPDFIVEREHRLRHCAIMERGPVCLH